MAWIKRWRRRIVALVRPAAADRELNEELAFHIEQETAKLVREGVGSSRVDLQACKLEYSIVSPK